MTCAERCPPLLVLCGPTATGKTDLGIELARRFDGEIVNADSRQVYRYMDIGTAKPTGAQRTRAPHHLLDFVEPDEPFTLADYLDRARAAVTAIQARGRLPIAVGGTGLYVRALAQAYDVPRVPPDRELRATLEDALAAGGTAALAERLRAVDPAAAERVDAANPRRLIRAIEVAERGRRSSMAECRPLPQMSERRHTSGAAEPAVPRFDALVLGLHGERAGLHQRADDRIAAMVASGFVAEVAGLLARGYRDDLPSFSSLGYRELASYLRGERSLDDAVAAMRYATHRFIRRQLTWFRKEPGIAWLDIADPELSARASAAVEAWLRRAAPSRA